MLYNLFKGFFQISLHLFFRSVHVQGREHILARGPVLICANHPGALLDPLVIALLIGRRVHFLAKAVVFKGKFAQWLLPKLNMIPVYRKQDDPSQTHKNEETFAQCYKYLAKGAAILIFPEGISITERKLRELKTGAARIALGAEAANEYRLNLQIVTVGINYEDPHSYGRDLFLNIAPPIRVGDYIDQYKNEGFSAAEALTETIRERLEEQIVHIHHTEDDELVAQVERLYGDELRKQLTLSQTESFQDSPVEEFHLTRRIVDTVGWFRNHHPEYLYDLRKKISSYFWKVEQLGLSDVAVSQNRTDLKRSLSLLLVLVFGFPVYIYGLVHNSIPFILSSWLSKRVVKQREFHGAIGMLSGAFLFLIWYSILFALGLTLFSKVWMVIVYMLTWLPSGLFSWYYYRIVLSMRKRWQLRTLFWRRQTLIAELVSQRKALIRQLEDAADFYRKTN